MEVVNGSDLKVGDTIVVWSGYTRNRDTITGVRPYKGPLEYLWPEGTILVSFVANTSGMTVSNTDKIERITK